MEPAEMTPGELRAARLVAARPLTLLTVARAVFVTWRTANETRHVELVAGLRSYLDRSPCFELGKIEFEGHGPMVSLSDCGRRLFREATRPDLKLEHEPRRS